MGGGRRRPSAALRRRRRLAASVALAVLLAVVLALASTSLSRPASAGSLPEGRRTHVVQPGETYWSIAATYAADGADLRLAVDRLLDANDARPLFPGDRVELPR